MLNTADRHREGTPRSSVLVSEHPPLTINSESLEGGAQASVMFKLPIRFQRATTAMERCYSKCCSQTSSTDVSGNLLQMQKLRPQLRPSQSESVFSQDPQNIHKHIKVKEAMVQRSFSQSVAPRPPVSNSSRGWEGGGMGIRGLLKEADSGDYNSTSLRVGP